MFGHQHDRDHGDGHVHSHDQHCDHDLATLDAPGPVSPAVEEMESANKSLADALRVSFRLLSVVMFVLVVAYLLSGLFAVNANEKAVVLRFGKVVGSEAGKSLGTVLGPGFHISWPYPVDQVVKVPTSQQELRDKSFWHAESPGDAVRPQELIQAQSEGLRPGWDGALMTGDKGLIHVKWKCNYHVPTDDDEAVLDYVTNASDVKAILQTALQNASIHTAGAMKIDVIWLNDPRFLGEVIRLTQKTLNEMHTGIQIDSLTLDGNRPPLQTKAAFAAVTTAQQEAEKAHTEALKARNELLGGAAGANWEEIKKAIDRYDRGLATGNQAEADKQYQAITDLLLANSTKGKAKEMINEANTYRATVRQDAARFENRFLFLLPSYRENPQFTIDQLWTQAQQEILARDTIEKFYVPAGMKQVLQLGSDPKVAKKLQEMELQATQDKVQQERKQGQN